MTKDDLIFDRIYSKDDWVFRQSYSADRLVWWGHLPRGDGMSLCGKAATEGRGTFKNPETLQGEKNHCQLCWARARRAVIVKEK